MTRTIKTIHTDHDTTIEIEELGDGMYPGEPGVVDHDYRIVERDEYNNPVAPCIYARTLADAKFFARQMAL